MKKTTWKQWQLPAGVTRGLWDYTQSETIASTYDEYFECHKLLKFDQLLVRDALASTDAKLVADLGCGTGRALIPLVRAGARGLAIDLSEHMLCEVRSKADREDLAIECLLANLVDLDCLASDCVDHAICLFSTLGMIHGHANRHRFIGHVRRIVKPGGRFVVHVHNYWAHLFDPGGVPAILSNLLMSSFSDRVQRGDRHFPYRGVPQMYLHSFTPRELRQLLESNGFHVLQWHRLNERQSGSLRCGWLMGTLRERLDRRLRLTPAAPRWPVSIEDED